MSLWRHDFAGGPVILVPLIVILYIPASLYNGITSIPYVATIFSTGGTVTSLSGALGFTISATIFLLLVLSTGCLMRTTAGRLPGSGLNAVMNRIPLVRIVYNASKLAVEIALIGTEDLQKPAHLETWPGIRMTALKTGKTTKDGKVTVFMPTAPDITTRFVMEVDPEGIEETGEEVGETLTRVLSTGSTEQDHVNGFNIEVTEESSGGRAPSDE